MTETRTERMLVILTNRGLAVEYADYLLTPHFVRRVIENTNAGEIQVALADLERAKYVVELLEADLDESDESWCLEVLDQLRRAVMAFYK